MRLPRSFYAAFYKYREDWGDKEYDVDDMLKGALPLLEEHLAGDHGQVLKWAMLRQANDSIENTENKPDPEHEDLFSYDAHVPLGENRRVKRRRMDFQQHIRRKIVIDRNHASQNKSWDRETSWLNEGISALRAVPSDTTREMVLEEDGTVKAIEPVS